ncbi:cytochrome-c oxidase [uncultured Campylobacter sp.]|uniref:cytochrome-c oxidase n=1 Tax=uncultured Campylobacter sp. TaxID=218934 RepID=UPI00260D1071|nr:cytochrome-c oxidase [uncultured Campylobacter sp.]
MSKILSAALAASLAFTLINAQGYAAMPMPRADTSNFMPSKNAKFVSQTADDAPQKVNSVDIYVSNLYSASGGVPNYVRVYDAIDGLLMENNVESLQKAIKIIEDAPGLVAPSTLMTVAARAFDLGLKDEAAFWFYVGKNRFIVFTEVLDVKDPVFASTMDVNLAFVKLVGDVINPYAFCDLKKQRAAILRANEWTKAHPTRRCF